MGLFCGKTWFVSRANRVTMVKVSFNAALAQKDVKKDAESLIPEEEDKVSRKWPSELSSLLGLKGKKTLCAAQDFVSPGFSFSTAG